MDVAMTRVRPVLSQRRPRSKFPSAHRRTDPFIQNLEQCWDVTPLGLATLDRDSRILQKNKAFTLFCPDGLNPYFQKPLEALVRKVFRTKTKVINMELAGRRGVQRDRPDRWRVSCFPLLGRRGSLRTLLLTIQDITDTKRLEETKVREIERKFHSIADAAPVMIWQSGAHNGCIYCNKHWLEFTGRSMRDQLGNGWAESVHPDDRNRCIELYERAFEMRENFTVEYRLRRADGEYRWVLVNGRPVLDAEGKFAGYMGTCVDMTDFRYTQLELQKNQMELSHARRVSAVGELASSIAHELNQPLSAILSNAQAAQRFLKTDPTNILEVQDILEDIVSDDKRAGAIIRRLRGLMKKKELEADILSLNDVVQEVVALLQGDALNRGIRVELNLRDNLAPIRADNIQLQQVLLNFILNAFDSMAEVPEETRCVTIQTRQINDAQIRFSVKDTGRGIPAEQIETIFQPFFTTKKEGLGMGLAIVRSIVQAHNGQLWAENNPEGGATFHVTLPVHHV
jgi:PAS domain S-box-containing protein